tara:strand:- start:439 stop:1077 length:639 start_codon:yes stop_codon:yes gene_type:complete
MKLNIHSQDGSRVASINVDKFIFGIEPNLSAVNQAVNTELTNLRQGTRSSKNRSKVRGGGKKPFKQKGRGGARAGTIRSPLWKGGGAVFGPQPHKYSIKMPKKMRNLARRSVLSNHFKNNNIIVLSSINMEAPSTKEFKKILSDLKIEKNKITVVYSKPNKNLILSARNLKNVYTVNVLSLSTYDMIDCDSLLIEESALENLNLLLSSSNEK